MFQWARIRRLILGSALLATVVASVWPNVPESSAPEVVVHVASREAPPLRERLAQGKSDLPALGARLERGPMTTEVRDLFASKTWTPPPSQTQRAAPPVAPAPIAPPFPYSFAGSIVDANGVVLVFTNQQQSFVLRVGEVLERTYRIEAASTQAVTITYLPLGLTQVIPTGRLE